MITAILPIRLVSVANIREHWAKRAKRTSEQRNLVKFALRNQTHKAWKDGELKKLLVSITRIAPRELDGDNLQSACKATRDGVADALTVDDRHPDISWEYRQMKGMPKEYAVQIEISDIADWDKLP